MAIELPVDFVARSHRGPQWADWVDSLPRLVGALLAAWELTVGSEVWTGETAAVFGVRTITGEPAVLKVGFPEPEVEHEHLVLRAWGGTGAVRLLRADPRRQALLLERAGPGSLNDRPALEACSVVAGLYALLHRRPLPQLARLSDHCRRWAEELTALRTSNLVPRRFVDQAIGLAGDFAADPETDRVLVHTDLHYDNVLAAEREPWLAIDPKPMAGDPAYEVAPLLWNRWAEAAATGDLRGALLERLFTVVDGADLDEERVRDWVVVRELVNVMWALGEGAAERDPDRITRGTTLVKAVQR